MPGRKAPENDFIISRTDLAGIAEEAIEQHQSLLIQSGVRIETGDLAQTVYTDGKWVCFYLRTASAECGPIPHRYSGHHPCPPGSWAGRYSLPSRITGSASHLMNSPGL